MKSLFLAALTATLLSSCCGQCGTAAAPADKPAVTNAPPAAPTEPASAAPAAAEAPKP
jgi:hypothetical protein